MKLSARGAALLVVQTLKLDAPPRPLDVLISEALRSQQEQQDAVEERAFRLTLTVKQVLTDTLRQCLRDGHQPKFAFNSSSDYMLQGACFVEPSDSDEVREQKLRRLHWRSYYDSLRQLSPREFEVLCGKILGLLGVPNPQLTRYQADQGIDFYGRLSLGDLVGHGAVFPVFETRIEVWLIGQAKHYLHSKVATPDVRELVGATLLGRARVFSDLELYPDLHIRPGDPVLMLFFTTGEISSDGWALCARSGVAAMDGEMLATFLADKKIAVEDDANGECFNAHEFASWLKT